MLCDVKEPPGVSKGVAIFKVLHFDPENSSVGTAGEGYCALGELAGGSQPGVG